MSRLTPRLRWRQALCSKGFPANLRVVKSTLLSLVDQMTPNGELRRWRFELADAIGIPERTLDRHLQRAVDAGWLIRTVPGGNGRRAVYNANIPDELCATSGAQLGKLCAACSCATPGSCAPPGGELNKKSANDSERVAVDNHRGRQRAHDGSGVSATDYLRKSSSYKEWLPTPLDAASHDTTGEVA